MRKGTSFKKIGANFSNSHDERAYKAQVLNDVIIDTFERF